MILGSADSGKSTVLEVIVLLFSHVPNVTISEFDYHARQVALGFSIQAVLAIADECLFGDIGISPPLQGWLNGRLTDLPDENGAEPVLVCRLTGTPHYEAVYEVIPAGKCACSTGPSRCQWQQSAANRGRDLRSRSITREPRSGSRR